MNVGGKKMLVIIDMQNHILDPNSDFIFQNQTNWRNALLND